MKNTINTLMGILLIVLMVLPTSLGIFVGVFFIILPLVLLTLITVVLGFTQKN